MTKKLPLDKLNEQSLFEEKEEISNGLSLEQNSQTTKLEEENPESFQEAVNELKVIVNELENVQGDLDKSVALFKRGMHLAKWSEHYLDQMEEQITNIISSSEQDL